MCGSPWCKTHLGGHPHAVFINPKQCCTCKEVNEKLNLLLLSRNSHSSTLASSCIVLCSLPTDWKTHDVSLSTVALNLFKSLDIQVHITAKITLNGVLVNLLTKFGEIIFCQVLCANGSVNALQLSHSGAIIQVYYIYGHCTVGIVMHG